MSWWNICGGYVRIARVGFVPLMIKPFSRSKEELPVTALLREAEIVDKTKPSFTEEFCHAGRYQNNLKFVYREFVEDLARPAFSQEVQYDLEEGNMIGFAELLMEVFQASNTSITYKVINTFE